MIIPSKVCLKAITLKKKLNFYIKKKYRKLLAKYHPDKYKDFPEKDRRTKDKQFQLVQMAGKVLTDESAKKEIGRAHV